MMPSVISSPSSDEISTPATTNGNASMKMPMKILTNPWTRVVSERSAMGSAQPLPTQSSSATGTYSSQPNGIHARRTIVVGSDSVRIASRLGSQAATKGECRQCKYSKNGHDRQNRAQLQSYWLSPFLSDQRMRICHV